MSSTGKKVFYFVLGTVFGSVGIRLLCSKDAKKAYTNIAAAGLRVKEDVMKTVTAVQENIGDIMADAKAINESRAAAEGEIIESAEDSTPEQDVQ